MPLTHLLRRLISPRLMNEKLILIISLIIASAMKKLNARNQIPSMFQIQLPL
jgi:hypothetical protein